MQFKHPEILYALFLLLIPILIHLFQLRRFQKIAFTNVAFLKKVTIQTRKSSQLKKWLTLLMRLLALACVILAFAQPFQASTTALNTQKETVLYLDNSFSMQAKGAQGPLLQRAIQQLYERSNGSEKISWFTNTETFKDDSSQDFKNEILKTPYSYKQLSVKNMLLKGAQLFSKDKSSDKRLIVISDFQRQESLPNLEDDFSIEAVQLLPVTRNNITIDTAFVVSKNNSTTTLKVGVTRHGEGPQSVPVSLYNEKTLIAKTAVDFSDRFKNEITFDIENEGVFRGKLEINDPQLTFDNTLYFALNAPKKLKVLSINEADGSFLQRLFDPSEYDYVQVPFNSLSYNDIPNQNFIVLNEVKTIPGSLATALKSFTDNGGSVFVIPSDSPDIGSYNTLLNALNLGSFNEKLNQEKKITQIIFSHPLFADVFEKQVVNFQYPKVNSFLEVQSNATSALRFEDGKAFILQRGLIYVASAAINKDNSNFQSSPLIVPTIINMANSSLPLPKLYYSIGRQNTYAVPVKLLQDEIVSLRDSVSSFIPLQQTKANDVRITTTDVPSRSGVYSIEKETDFIENVSYNYPRTESIMQYASLGDWQGVRPHDSIAELFDTITEENSIQSFWKWFVIFAILFLILEMLILKFFR